MWSCCAAAAGKAQQGQQQGGEQQQEGGRKRQDATDPVLGEKASWCGQVGCSLVCALLHPQLGYLLSLWVATVRVSRARIGCFPCEEANSRPLQPAALGLTNRACLGTLSAMQVCPNIKRCWKAAREVVMLACRAAVTFLFFFAKRIRYKLNYEFIQVIGTGLAGALAFLKDRGELSKPVEWAGRTNDSKKVNVSRGRRGGVPMCSAPRSYLDIEATSGFARFAAVAFCTMYAGGPRFAVLGKSAAQRQSGRMRCPLVAACSIVSAPARRDCCTVNTNTGAMVPSL